MGKKLLLPTDFSKNSLNAMEYAIQLYKNEDCDFYILNTYAKDSHSLDSVALLDPDEAFNKLSENRSKQGLGDILTHLTFENDNPKHRFHVMSRPYPFLDAVKDVVKSMQIDMLVIGAKGMTNRRMGKYGKTALSVIEQIRNCPVLIVPKNAVFNEPKEIVLATNFKTDFNPSEIRHLAEIAKLSKSSIQVLSLEDPDSLNDRQKANKKLLSTYFEDIDHTFNTVRNVEMPTAINCFVEIRRSHMVSYINKKRTFLQKMGLGQPTLGKLVYFENVPVLALNDK
ncbi:universal stress protein [Zobellia galactanivorans]|uniref:Universal stress protein n=1 Tax=Zobellia galactanivorans (strain DSM 12802 / CCUG 47099 / CIP 106680 / NCIMB 13871 / Dsij) TaxID=63186 RepID=G0KZS0_ZOBGA|nr:universal stress protein [Zobellia galactanivorans]MBU3025091.1 universal stress protein [Zobellia galactanivorans]CAZ97144.1 Universal stress protein [Zobellia galactanivorans]